MSNPEQPIVTEQRVKKRRRKKKSEEPVVEPVVEPSEEPESEEVCGELTGYFILDEGDPAVYTVYTPDGEEVAIDEGGDLPQTILRFMENGWTLYGNPWTYVKTVEGESVQFHCQTVVLYS